MNTNETAQVNYYPIENGIIGGEQGTNFMPKEEVGRNQDMVDRGIIRDWTVNSLRLGSDPALLGWQFTGTFSSSDSDTVAWTAGTLTLSDGQTFSISAGNTGNMTALTYIYFDRAISTTVLQTTTTASSAVGTGKILLATAKPGLGGTDISETANDLFITALTSTRIAFWDMGDDVLRTYDFDGLNWSQVGNSFALSFFNPASMSAMSSSRIVYCNDENDEIRTYDFNGTDWAQVGNALDLSAGSPQVTALSSTRIAFIDNTNDQLRAYDFDGTNWTLTGNGLNISSVNAKAIVALSSSRIAFIDNGNNQLRAYDFNGTDWTLTGNGLNITGISTGISLAKLSSSRIAFLDNGNDQLRAYDFDGTDWTLTGSGLSISSMSGVAGTEFCITGLTTSRIVQVDLNSLELRIYEFDGSTWTQFGSDATFQVYGGSGGVKVEIDGIPDRSITYIKIAEKTLTTGEIEDNTIDAVLLEATNTEADNDIVTYDSASGGFTFNTPAEIITAGTGLSWNGDAELNVDDAYLLNNGDVGTGVYDFGGASSFEIPNAAGGTTVDAAGEVTIDTTSKTLNFYDGATEVALTPIQSQHFTIASPGAAEDYSVFYTEKAITITKIVAVLIGSASPSVTWTIRHDADRSAAGTEVVTGGTTTTSVTTGSVVTSFNDATVIANAFIWFETTAQSGTVNSINVTIFYKQDP